MYSRVTILALVLCLAQCYYSFHLTKSVQSHSSVRLPAFKTCLRCQFSSPSTIVDSQLVTASRGRNAVWNIPNMLTVSRIFAIPLFAGTYLANLQVPMLGLYITSCLTDWLDGYLARKWKMLSDFGAFLDPVADKLMVAMALVLLTSRFPTYLLSVPVALIMCRELGVSALREWMASRGKRSVVEVGIWGKLKTACQMVATVLLLSVTPTSSQSYDVCGRLGLSKLSVFSAGIVMLHVSTALTLFSGWQYLHAAWPTLMGRDEPQ